VFRFGSLFVVLVFAVPGSARADWLFGGYMGAAGTSSNTLTVNPASAPSFSIDDVAYKGQAFRSPWYYGVRAGWLPAETKGVGVEIEWTHAKAIAQIDPRASDLNAFQQSHGLNFLLGNLAYRFPAACDGRCTGVVRGGAGISTPHVESTFRNVHQEQYQRGGFAWQLGGGLEYHVWQFVYGIADARITRVTEHHLRGAGVEIAGSFFTRHVDFGVALRLPNR
jgi:lipid A oxidase